jgi:two-component system alkaline phosphatase synthesis response regulator PhoP
MSKRQILVIEDEEDIREVITYNLTKEGYRVTCAISGEDGLKSARNNPPNIIVLDLMLPGIDGLEVCRILKYDSRTQHVPIVMLTAKGEEADIVTGLELGADDYITKPFSPKVLIARLRALLRRITVKSAGETEVLRIHDLVITPGRHEVLVSDKQVTLTQTEFKILLTLARKPGWVFTRYQIVNAARGEDTVVTDRSVDVQIVGLRKKLGSAGKYIETVRGIGYRFVE